MTEVDKLMSVLEGVCPDCEGDLQTVEISGTQYWLSHDCSFPTNNGVEVRQWNSSDGHTLGCIIQKCDGCGAQFEAYANRFGDWSM